MEELVALVSKKTGLSQDQATAAVNVVLDFIKKKLPAPVAAQVDAVLSGSGGLREAAKALDGGEDIANLLGGLLGGEKNRK
jgi:uncharacterized protein (DUF2267 family)